MYLWPRKLPISYGMLFWRDNTPRWIVYTADMGICIGSLAIAYIVRFNFDVEALEKEIRDFPWVFPIVIGIRGFIFLIARTYSGLVRYTSTKDAQRIFVAISVGSLTFVLLNILRNHGYDGKHVVPYMVIIIEFLLTLFLMITSRMAVKVIYYELKSSRKDRSNVLIYGAGDSGIITKRTIDRDDGNNYNVIGFVDDNLKKAGKKAEGIRIYSPEQLGELIEKKNIDHLIISIQNLDSHHKAAVVEKALQHDVNVLNVPPVLNWINGELSMKQIKSVRIEDLLGRSPIKLNEVSIGKQLKKKVVLVTGAAGSIGSEIARQVVRYQPAQLILLDQAESPLYELELELQDKFGMNCCEVVIGNIRTTERLHNVFSTFQPDILFHAAAYKHVPMMENNPSEAIRTNILGTKNLVDLALEYNVGHFVMISTDKAVNPTNVMGASKRIAEIYAQASGSRGKTKFITTRFGNVLGSNGSVIPLFRKQIEKGGPITVTHPEIKRYFMTIPEACQLVLEAGAMGQGGEIFIFNMGKSIRIVDLAKQMIKLSGLELGKDIQIKFTGLRPGEKLYEELLDDGENTIPTHHPQIMIAKVREYDFETISGKIGDLITSYGEQENERIVSKMKAIVPEYLSQNSIYTKLDSINQQNETP